MQQIKLLLVLDSVDRPYTAGSPVTGTVEVKAIHPIELRAAGGRLFFSADLRFVTQFAEGR